MQVTTQEWDAYELQEQTRLRALIIAAKHSTRANARLETQDEQLRDMNIHVDNTNEGK